MDDRGLSTGNPGGSPSPESLADLIDRMAAERPDETYLEDARSRRVYRRSAFAAAARAWASALDGRGIGRGAAVLVDVADPLSFAAVHLGVIAAGRCSIPVNPELSWAEVERLSELAGGAALVVSDREGSGELAGTETMRVDADAGTPEAGTERPARPTPPVADGGAALLFTSGSTGEPKGVLLPEDQLLFVARAVARHNRLVPSDRGYNPLPLFHVNAEVVGLLATLVAGATLVLDRRFHRTGFWELLRDRRVTWLNAVPAMLAVLARGASIDLPESLRFVRSASAPLPVAVRQAMTGVSLVVSYGMTEAASQITATPLGEPPRDGSVGIPVGCEVAVRDAEGAVVPAGEVGNIWITGPGIVRSYLGGRASDRFDENGWLSTGDLGTIDEDGYVYLVGRSDDVINRGGEKVYPAEVEEVLLGDPRVREAVVVGRPDEVLGHVPVAYVIPTRETTATEAAELTDALLARAAAELPRFKRPVEITVVDDVPRAPTGKVQRARVRDLAASE
ncbi:MAG TPA: AMP-binding protein [Lacisediminihabitans sp.]|uniref:class I adenylate-forming enzyme family protein n=1 Tax=Lacisediminihabitans sp. TaxID=2787631 RepID=UPI002ED96023